MTVRIPLTVGRARVDSGIVALVDAEDASRIREYRWRVMTVGSTRLLYAATGKSVLMHRLITDAPKGLYVDHINGNGLDNRKVNLRLGSHSFNLANQAAHQTRKGKPTQSKYKGVTIPFEGRVRPFRATISVDGKQHFLGYHLTEEEAARAYDEAATRFFGQFARTNFPVEGA